jgi:hypothetical protein
MPATNNQLVRIFNTPTADGVKVELKRRKDADAKWPDAEVIESQEFSVAGIPNVLVDGDGETSLAAYGLWKMLGERVSELSASEKITAMAAIVDKLQQGIWREKSEKSERAASIDPIFAQAISELKGWSLAQATKTLQALDAQQRKALKTSDKVRAKIAELTEAVEVGDVSDLI